MKTRKRGGVPTKNKKNPKSIFKANGRFSSKSLKNQKIPLNKNRISFNPSVTNFMRPAPVKLLTDEKSDMNLFKFRQDKENEIRSLRRHSNKSFSQRDANLRAKQLHEKVAEYTELEQQLQQINKNDPTQFARIAEIEKKIQELDKDLEYDEEPKQKPKQDLSDSCTISGGRKTRIKRKLRKRKSTNRQF